MALSLAKKGRLASSFLKSQFSPLPLWTHLWVTDRCNLACSYCEVVENKKKDPSAEEVTSWISHAYDLETAVIAFMGGEPTLRKDLHELIRSASKKNLITYLTSHGQKKALSSENLAKFGEAGLDILEISLDGYDALQGSEKTLRGDENLIDRLEDAREKYGILYKAHQVLAPEALDETPKLLDLAERRLLPISFGLVTEFAGFFRRSAIYSNINIKEKLEKTLALIVEKKRKGVPVVNPFAYFEDALRFLRAPLRWNCDIGTYMIQVATNGEVFRCSKYNKLTTGTKFIDTDRDYFRNGEHGSEELLARCNRKCFSACAYTTSHFRCHPHDFIVSYALSN